MGLFEDLLLHKTKLAVIGLGYVGLPLAMALSNKFQVIGFDIDSKKIQLYRQGIDPFKEIGNKALIESSINFTNDDESLREAMLYIISVPTPIKQDYSPDLSAVYNASEIVGKYIKNDSIVVYESTFYPGLTEEICIPLLENVSNLKCGKNFKVGYSPERINPGDKEHSLANVIKIVSAVDSESLEIISKVYQLVVTAGVYPVKNIKIAEAAKIIENIQRDINVALMNELSMIFHIMDIDTIEVIRAAETKWNFLKFYPGLVGGHCIGVDPYYLTHKAKEFGYHSNIILSGRRINDNMGRYIAENTVKIMLKFGRSIKNSTVAILGVTFKENCSDLRNSKVFDIIKELNEYSVKVVLADPIAQKEEVKNLYGFDLVDLHCISNASVVIIAVAHEAFFKISREGFDKMYRKTTKIIIDVKGILNRVDYENNGYKYWRL